MAKIKITGDLGELKKSILDISKDFKDLSKSKVAIFDKEQRDFLSKEASKHVADIRKELDKNRKSIEDALKFQKQQTKSVDDEIRNRERVTKLLQRQIKLQRDMQRVQGAGTSFGGGGGAGGGILGRIGGMNGMAKGAGMAGLARLMGPVGMALAGGSLLFSRGAQASRVYQEGIDDRIALRGRGVSDMALSNADRAAGAGLNAQTMRRARLQSMDIFGAAGSTQNAVMQRAEVERNFGIQGGTLAGLGGQLRGQLGGPGANKAVMTIQAGLIASGISDEIGPYLETAANMLSSLNENGFSFNDSAMAVLNNLTREGVAAERAGRMITGVDKAIRGSSGEANAFFQNIFKNAGVGGSTVGGLQAAIRSGGLFGADLSKSNLGRTDLASFQQLGIGGRTGQKIAASTMTKLNQMFGGDEEINALLQSQDPEKRRAGAARRLQRNNFIMNTFGLENEVQGAEVNKMLKEMADPDTSRKRQKQIKDKIKNMADGNSELGNLKLINQSTAGAWTVLKNQHKTLQDELGGKIAPAAMSIDKTLLKLDSTISSLLDFLGIETADEKMNQAVMGKGVLDQKTFDQMTMGDPNREKEFSKRFADEFTKNQERINQLKAQGAEGDFTRTGRGVFAGKSLTELRTLQARNKQIVDSMRNVEGLDPSGLMKNDKIRNQFNTQTAKRVRQEQEENNTIRGKISNWFKNMFSDEYESPIKRKPEGKTTKTETSDLTPVMKELVNINKEQNQNLKSIDRKQKPGSIPNKGSKTGL